MRLRKRFDRAAYAERVAAILSHEFGWDDETRDILAHGLAHGAELMPWFEFVCDNPASARFRLKKNPPVGPWALRLAYYPVSRPGNVDGENRAKRVTYQLTEAYEEAT